MRKFLHNIFILPIRRLIRKAIKLEIESSIKELIQPAVQQAVKETALEDIIKGKTFIAINELANESMDILLKDSLKQTIENCLYELMYEMHEEHLNKLLKKPIHKLIKPNRKSNIHNKTIDHILGEIIPDHLTVSINHFENGLKLRSTKHCIPLTNSAKELFEKFTLGRVTDEEYQTLETYILERC